ncbi:MAG: hypothetical protein IPI63_11225 [Methanothrix sp.]|nr:hypothetical protein [Methanothrix sp.]
MGDQLLSDQSLELIKIQRPINPENQFNPVQPLEVLILFLHNLLYLPARLIEDERLSCSDKDDIAIEFFTENSYGIMNQLPVLMRDRLHLIQDDYGVSELIEFSDQLVLIGEEGVEILPESGDYYLCIPAFQKQ